jgi:hypothetical protein
VASPSGKPVVQKLGIKPGFRIFVDRAPATYAAIVGELPDGVTVLSLAKPSDGTGALVPSYRSAPSRGPRVSERHPINRTRLAVISLAVALVCAGMLTLLVRDRWNRPEVQSAEQARYATTGEAAQAAGAKVLPTAPKRAVEPAPAGPAQAQPANPN